MTFHVLCSGEGLISLFNILIIGRKTTDNKKEAQLLRMFYARINIDSKSPQHLTGQTLHNRSDQL